eukprot:TRINITY_DN3328_c0_g1_i1.p1 TRINITY_DN3328_c0_g1~~TRINITY_DN3328_c0_g1_i1.p1  ORF type:complete len:554 (+),score=197.21 TRINITY_DN3328_c0_g1_i1:214-1875(+)
MASMGGQRQSREDFKKKKELEELRKAGTIAPEVDEDGNMINPHIPQYMSQAPWYLDQKVGLKHQKGWMEKHTMKGSLSRSVADLGKKKGISRTRDEFGELIKPKKGGRRGKQEDQVQMPRDNGYDDSYDGKHDRWNGYDPSHYKQVMDKFDKVEEARRKSKAAEMEQKMAARKAKKAVKEAAKEAKRLAKEQKLKERAAQGTLGAEESESESEPDSESDDDGLNDDDDKLRNEDNQMGSKFDNHEGGSKGIRTTVRNLRIREDTAKYLYNLDPSSAYYDPKSRSMRADPRPHIDVDQKLYAGDNMVRASGDVGGFSQSKVYAWQASERGQNLTLEANPTATALMHQRYTEKKESVNEVHANKLLEKYGNASKPAPNQELILGQTEHYVEYSRDGRLVKGQEKQVPKSKFPEDVHPGNHTSVWGSFFDKRSRQWGYACCHNLSRNAYCVPVSEQEMIAPPPVAEEVEEEEEEEEAPKKKKTQKEEEEEKAEKMKKALAKHAKEQKEWREGEEAGEMKRKYNSMKSTEVTEEEMEVYRMKKIRSDDPMAKFLANK